jgi:KUP system potassium uptake protein
VDDEHDAERAPCQAAEAARLALSRGLSGWIIEFHEVVPARRPSRCCVRRVKWRVERAASFAALGALLEREVHSRRACFEDLRLARTPLRFRRARATFGSGRRSRCTLRRVTMPVEVKQNAGHSEPHGEHGGSLALLALGALGVVFGDIGTSPLYTLRECLHMVGAEHATPDDLLGVLSLIFWSLTMVVTVKYLGFVMRADNQGEGGIFALLAILPGALRTHRSRSTAVPPPSAAEDNIVAGMTWVSTLVVFGAALLYGDGAITPAISVLSAIEGLAVAKPALEPLIEPVTCAILIGLFLLQRRGTGTVGRLFGPVMALWFATIGALGLHQVLHNPSVLRALWPGYAVRFFEIHGWPGFLVLGSVVLAVTGGEALYADMGHFGARPIRLVWLWFALPALLLCYFGQGALVLREPARAAQPFFGLVPAGWATWALVGLSSTATVIASQALISGAFSLTRQAMQLGFFPRVTIKHTARHMEGQIYVPEVNWLLAVACVLLVLGFRRSEGLAAAYGIAVTGTMTITSIVYYVVLRHVFHWSIARALPLLILFLCFDIPFFAANVFKIVDGGWVPVMIGIGCVAAMLVWSRGRTLLIEEYGKRFPSYEEALPMIERELQARVPGAAVFMASSTTHLPPSLMHFVQRVKVLPETVVLLTVITESVPLVPAKRRYHVTSLGRGIHRLIVHYGFMDYQAIPIVLQRAHDESALPIDPEAITYYLGRDTFLATSAGKMGVIAEGIFAFLSRNAVPADRNFGIPSKQVVEIGLQLDL